jgi:hypothetical protein
LEYYGLRWEYDPVNNYPPPQKLLRS